MPAPAKSRPWDPNHLACSNTWAFLRGLGEFNQTFSRAGDLKMSDLAFWNETATPAARAADAMALASRLDRIFVKALLARYEEGSARPLAVQALTNALTDRSITLCDLSYVVDDHYNFRGELK